MFSKDQTWAAPVRKLACGCFIYQPRRLPDEQNPTAEEGVLSDWLEKDSHTPWNLRKTHKITSGRKVLASWGGLMPDHHRIPSCVRTCPTFTSIQGGIRINAKGWSENHETGWREKRNLSGLFPQPVSWQRRKNPAQPYPNMKFKVNYYYYYLQPCGWS